MPRFPLTTGDTQLRAEVIDAMIKQVAARSYKFKQAVSIVPTSAWTNTFYREELEVTSGPTGNPFKGLARGADFPNKDTAWEKVSNRITKFGSEAKIFFEDILANDINIQARTIIRRTEDVIKAVDDQIWDDLTESRSGTGRIQSFALASNYEWDASSAAIIDNLMKASQIIGENGNYDTSDLMCFVSPKDERSIKNYLADKGAQWMPIATDIAKNGRIGQVAGVNIVVSNSVTASYALVVKPKTCATWRELVSLRSDVKTDPFKDTRIRIVEEGVLELTDPLSAVLISNTQD